MSDTSMFCFQCEQTAGGKGCTRGGVCGKPSDVAIKHDQLTAVLIELARAAMSPLMWSMSTSWNDCMKPPSLRRITENQPSLRPRKNTINDERDEK